MKHGVSRCVLYVIFATVCNGICGMDGGSARTYPKRIPDGRRKSRSVSRTTTYKKQGFLTRWFKVGSKKPVVKTVYTTEQLVEKLDQSNKEKSILKFKLTELKKKNTRLAKKNETLESAIKIIRSHNASDKDLKDQAMRVCYVKRNENIRLRKENKDLRDKLARYEKQNTVQL